MSANANKKTNSGIPENGTTSPRRFLPVQPVGTLAIPVGDERRDRGGDRHREEWGGEPAPQMVKHRLRIAKQELPLAKQELPLAKQELRLAKAKPR